MRRKLVIACAVALALLACSFGLVAHLSSQSQRDGEARTSVVDLNEVLQLQQAADAGDEQASALLPGKVEQLRASIIDQAGGSSQDILPFLIGVFAICCLFVIAVAAYAYLRLIRPFERLQEFAGEVAKGDLERALPYERQNLFGDFTWAFDRMRREISRARIAEQNAVESNKTVVASLSHDIKTPVSSVRAYAEALEMGLDATPEDRRRYLGMIISKCDEVAELTDDLFLHSVSDLDRLNVTCSDWFAPDVFASVLEETALDSDDIVLENEVPPIKITADERRLSQVFGNILANVRKYAPGAPVHVRFDRLSAALRVSIEDEGPGVDPKDLPFLKDRFYRGSNAHEQQGVGLGLAIVDYLMERMGGSVTVSNGARGLLIVLVFAQAEQAGERGARTPPLTSLGGA